MTLQEFIGKYNGQSLDFDGAFGSQCMDLVEQYNKEVINAPRIGGNAIDVWSSYPADFYEKVSNTPEGVPSPGDIVIWGTGVGQFGHIAVFRDGDTNHFNSFDQNWPLNSLCHIQNHDYTNVLGWLHPKRVQDTQAVIDDLRLARDKNWQLYESEIIKNTDLTNQIGELNKKVGELNDSNNKLQQEIKDILDKCASLANQLEDIHTKDSEAINVGQQAQTDLKNLNIDIAALGTILGTGTTLDDIKTYIDKQAGDLKICRMARDNQNKQARTALQQILGIFGIKI